MSNDYNVLFVAIDSLTRYFLDAYDDGRDEFDVETDSLDAFAERAATFDSHYAGSLPCMPARREWLAGVQEFLWRPWGPIEPFDTTLPERARRADVLTQLITDHFHYFQHGSHGYYEDFHGFEFVRGHEYDAWQTTPKQPDERLLEQIVKRSDGEDADANRGVATADADPLDLRYMNRAQYARNVDSFDCEEDFFAPKVFSAAADWLAENQDWEQWLLYVDSFDVHEPFHVPEPYASMYTDEDPTDPDLELWPYYGHVDEGQSELTDRQLEFVRAQFAGKITMVDRWFGRMMEQFDELGLWDETVVIVTSDHGHFLGEHGWIGKPFNAPLYDVLARTPLFVWHPDSPRCGESIDALTSAVDLHATMASILDADIQDTVHSRDLGPLLRGNIDSIRDWALYGYWGGSVNVTDGTYTYLHPCDESVEAETHSTSMIDSYGWFTPPEPKYDAEAGEFLPYTDSPVWRFSASSHSRHEEPLLFDVDADPAQRENLVDAEPDEVERMSELLRRALDELDAPDSQYRRLRFGDDE